MLSELVPEKLFHQVRQQEFVPVILIHDRRREEDLHIQDRAVLAVVWEVRPALPIRERGLQAVELTAIIVVHQLLAVVHTLAAVLLHVIARPVLIVVVVLLLPAVVTQVAVVVLPAVPAVVLPGQVAAVVVDHVPDKW